MKQIAALSLVMLIAAGCEYLPETLTLATNLNALEAQAAPQKLSGFFGAFSPTKDSLILNEVIAFSTEQQLDSLKVQISPSTQFKIMRPVRTGPNSHAWPGPAVPISASKLPPARDIHLVKVWGELVDGPEPHVRNTTVVIFNLNP